MLSMTFRLDLTVCGRFYELMKTKPPLYSDLVAE